jgi:hypothetical protein
MFILIAILLLFLSALVMLIIRLARPEFAYHWLVAVGGSLAAWVFILLAGLNLPQTLTIVSSSGVGDATSSPLVSFPGWPILLVDRLSWPFAVALATLALAVILTDVARAPEADWHAWAGSLALAGFGIIAALAGNPFTLLLAWMAIDVGELLVLLVQVKQSLLRERVVAAFSARLSGSVLLIMAGMIAYARTGQSLAFSMIPAQASIVLLVAAGLRLGVLPLHVPFLQEIPLRRSLGTITRLVPAAAALSLLARTATAEGNLTLAPYLLGLAGLAALYSGVAWVLAPDELAGRPAWILGMASLAVAAAVNNQPTAVLAWGMAMIFSGSVLFLTSVHDRRISWLTLLGLFGISMLPYSPTWNGARLFSPFQPLMLPFLVAQVFLMVGYVRHSLRSGTPLSGVERWVLVIYPLGLVWLLATHLIFGFWTNPGIKDVAPIGWWIGGFVSVMAGILILTTRRQLRFPRLVSGLFGTIFSFGWLYRVLWFGYRFVGRLVKIISNVLEGEGGVLWAMILLVLILLWIMNVNGI